MPVRQLDLYLKQRGLARTQQPLSELKGLRIGVDGLFWLRRLMHVSNKEPAVLAMAGTPLSLQQSVQSDIQQWRKHGVEVVIVFPGLIQPWRGDIRPFSTPDNRPQLRGQAWNFYAQGRKDAAMAAFSSAGTVPAAEMIPLVMQWLNDAGVECMRAPFASTAQLAYMDGQGLFHAVYASNDYLLYDVERLITAVDFEQSTYAWLEKAAVLQDLGVGDAQFLDACILAGFDYISTFPALVDPSTSFAFKSCIDMVLQFGSGYNASITFMHLPAVQQMNYVDLFLRTRCIINHHLVWTEDACVRPLHAETAPADLHEVVGHRFPDHVFFYLTQGLVSSQVINALGTHSIVEIVPLCNGQNPAFRTVLINDRLMAMRGNAISCLALCAGTAHMFRPVNLVSWMDPGYDYPLTTRHLASLFNTWTIPANFAAEKPTSMDLARVLSLLSDSKVVAASKEPARMPQSETHVMFVSLGQFLSLRGYILHEMHSLTTVGGALRHATTTVSPAMGSRFVPAWCLLMEMLLCGVPFTAAPNYDADLKALSPDLAADILFFSRIVGVLSLSHTGVPWTGPLSQDLLEFNSFSKIVGRSMRNLMEMLVLANTVRAPSAPIALTTEDKDSNNHQNNNFIKVAARLPFGRETNTASALVAKHFLLATCTKSSGKAAKGDSPAREWEKMGDELSFNSFVADWDYAGIWEQTMWQFWSGFGVFVAAIASQHDKKRTHLREEEWTAVEAAHRAFTRADQRVRQCHGRK